MMEIDDFITQPGRYFNCVETDLDKKTNKYWISFIDNPEDVRISWDEESIINPAKFNHIQIKEHISNKKWFFIESEVDWLRRRFRYCSCTECSRRRTESKGSG